MANRINQQAGQGQPRADFNQALTVLRQSGFILHNLELDALSDLTRDQMEQFRSAWQVLPLEQRRELVTALIEHAEDHVNANFDAIFRWLVEGSDDAWVRTQAIEGLWEDEDVRLINPLIRRLEMDSSDDVRAAAALSLGRFLLLGEYDQLEHSIARRIENALLDAYHVNDQDAWVRRRVLEALANSSNEELPDMIQTAYEDDDEIMRIGAVFAMGRSADPMWHPIVLEELGSSDNAMLLEAVRASGELQIEEALPDLIRLLSDEDVEIRDEAVWALGRIGGREARRALEACVASSDEDLSEAAEEALAEMDFMAGDNTMPGFFEPD